jgi:hypothetical protein
MNNEKLNGLVTKYQTDRSEETFAEIYSIVSSTWRNLDAVGKSVYSNASEMLATYEDMLLACIEVYDGSGNFSHLLNRYIWRKRNDIYKVNKARRKYMADITPLVNDDGSEAATYEPEDDFLIEDYLTAKKKADQRQLIDFLLTGADETTTAIVETFLQHPKPTPTAIGKVLGIHHSVVIRKLERLAGKFDARQFGDYSDYLVAL